MKPIMVSEQQETSVESPKSPPSTLKAQNAAKENNGSGSSSGASSFSALPGFKGNLNFVLPIKLERNNFLVWRSQVMPVLSRL